VSDARRVSIKSDFERLLSGLNKIRLRMRQKYPKVIFTGIDRSLKPARPLWAVAIDQVPIAAPEPIKHQIVELVKNRNELMDEIVDIEGDIHCLAKAQKRADNRNTQTPTINVEPHQPIIQISERPAVPQSVSYVTYPDNLIRELQIHRSDFDRIDATIRAMHFDRLSEAQKVYIQSQSEQLNSALNNLRLIIKHKYPKQLFIGIDRSSKPPPPLHITIQAPFVPYEPIRNKIVELVKNRNELIEEFVDIEGDIQCLAKAQKRADNRNTQSALDEVEAYLSQQLPTSSSSSSQWAAQTGVSGKTVFIGDSRDQFKFDKKTPVTIDDIAL